MRNRSLTRSDPSGNVHDRAILRSRNVVSSMLPPPMSTRPVRDREVVTAPRKPIRASRSRRSPGAGRRARGRARPGRRRRQPPGRPTWRPRASARRRPHPRSRGSRGARRARGRSPRTERVVAPQLEAEPQRRARILQHVEMFVRPRPEHDHPRRVASDVDHGERPVVLAGSWAGLHRAMLPHDGSGRDPEVGRGTGAARSRDRTPGERVHPPGAATAAGCPPLGPRRHRSWTLRAGRVLERDRR